MSKNLVLNLTLCRDYSSQFNTTTNGKKHNLRLIYNLVKTLMTGSWPTPNTLVIYDDATYATGTVTCASAQAADTVTIGGVVFTAVNGSPTGNQFDMSLASDTLVAADLVRSVNASATAGLSGVVTAANVAGVVTFTATIPGKIGNGVTLASSNGTRLAVSGARLASGASTNTITTNL